MTLQINQQKYQQQVANPVMGSFDLQSQYAQQQQLNLQLVDQVSALFEVFAAFFDRKFFEVQEFQYHYNKGIAVQNKLISSLIAWSNSFSKAKMGDGLQPLAYEQVPQFKQRKDEKRLSDDLRDHLKKIYDIKDDMIRNSVSFAASLDKNINSSMTQSIKTQQTQETKDSHQKLTKVGLPKTKDYGSKRNHQEMVMEESEVQDDSDGEARSNNFKEHIEALSNQHIQRQLTASNYSDQHSEGESVLIGDEDPVVISSQNSKNNLNSKGSPSRTTKLLHHNKHQAVKKSPNIQQKNAKAKSIIDQQNAELKDTQSLSSTQTKQIDFNSKSPFQYTQKSVGQKFNDKSPLKKEMNTTQSTKDKSPSTKGIGFNKQGRGSRQQQITNTYFAQARNKSQTKSKSPGANVSYQQYFISSQSQSQIKQNNNNFQSSRNNQITQNNSLTEQSKLQQHHFQSAQNYKLTERSGPSQLATELPDLQFTSSVQSSSGNSTGKQTNFENQLKQKKNNQSPGSNRYQSKTSKDDDEKIQNQYEEIKMNENSLKKTDKKSKEEERFEINLQQHTPVNQDERPKQDDSGHRFTLQGMQGQVANELINCQETRIREFRFSEAKDYPIIEVSETLELRQSKRFSNQKNKKGASGDKQNVQILETENLFSPTTQMNEIDLAQYNSPSFATANQLYQNYQSLHRQMQTEINQNRQGSSSSGRDSDLICLPLQYEQKIILNNIVRQRAKRTVFLQMPGEALNLIAEYLNQKLPIFIFTNRISFKIYLQHQIEFYEQQRQFATNQLGIMVKELDRIQNSVNFDLSLQTREEYDNLTQLEWKEIISACYIQSQGQKILLKQKDIIILRLYLTFMGLDIAEEQDDCRFLNQSSEFFKDCGLQILELLDPERSFVISDENKKKIKELLVNLQKEKLMEEEDNTSGMSNSGSYSSQEANKIQLAQKVVEALTNILYEALQFVQIIPNIQVADLKSEIDEYKKMCEGYDGVKNNLIDFKNLIS